MAKPFKPSPFESIIKKYTLCGLCDGKIIKSPFLQCGCSVILCIYCNEKHSCKLRHLAVKFNSYRDNKSISFIHQLAALITSTAEKDKEKKGLLEDSCSASLPDFDDLTANETQELSFSQLFDDTCSRNVKPRDSISSIKRESISPRISYTLKRKQYLSDSEDENYLKKNDSILHNRLSDCSSSSKKKVIKKRKYSNKGKNTSIISTSGCDSELLIPEEPQIEKKKHYRRGRSSGPEDMSYDVNDFSDLFLNKPSLPAPESCRTVKETSIPLEDKSHVNNNFATENNRSYCKESVRESNSNNVENTVQNIDKLSANNIDGTFDNNSLEENKDGLGICSPYKEIIKPNMVGDINGVDVILKETNDKRKASYDNKKQRNSIKHDKDSKCHKNKTVKTDKQIMKQKDNLILNCNLKDFDGFDQCEINASTLNYMLYKLTTPINDNDKMIFPMHYKGKTFIIHTRDKFDTESNDNEYHYILKRHKPFKNSFVQTEECKRIDDVCKVDSVDDPTSQIVRSTDGFKNEVCSGCDNFQNQEVQTDSYLVTEKSAGPEAKGNGITQTDSYGIVEACVGPEPKGYAVVQTDSFQIVDAFAGRDGDKDNFVQTDSYQVVNACVGPEGKISKTSQTDSYQVQTSCTSTKGFRSCAVQTDPVNDSSSHLSDMPFPTRKSLCHSSSNMVNKNISSENTKKTAANVSENSDIEDEDIIEGTPVKVNNLSQLQSLDLSAVKERTLHFDWNESTVTRDEIISCSDLTNTEKICVQKFTKCFGMEYSEYFSNKTTHLVVSSRLTHDSHKTFKYLVAIASKACVVSIQWVKESLLRKEVMPVAKYIPTNHAGPLRCRMNGTLPFAGLTICVQLLTNYPGVKAMEALCKLCGAYVVEDIGLYSSPQKWPFPRFCLFENESQLTSQILNSCSKNHIVAINHEWVFDSVAAYRRQPILKHLCSTFMLTDDIVGTYKIPRDMLVDNFM